MAQISNYSKFDWWAANIFYEKYVLGHEPDDKLLPDAVQKEEGVVQANQKLCDVMRQMKQTAANMNPHTRPIIAPSSSMPKILFFTFTYHSGQNSLIQTPSQS